MKRTCKRRKAFLGAIIGAVTGIAGSAISAASQRKANEKQIKRENYINRNQSANNLSNAYSNEEYVDDFLNKTTFKYGGNKTMAELPKTKLVRKLYVNPKYITKNTAKIPAQKLPKTRLAVKRDANVASNTTRNTIQKSTKKLTQKPTQTAKAVAKKDTNKTYTTDKNFGKRVTRSLINTGIDLAGGPIVFPQRTAEKIAKTYLNYMTNLIVNGHGKNPVKNSTQKTKSASPVTQTRTAVRRNTNAVSTSAKTNTNTAKSTTRQTTTTKSNASTKASTATNRPAQRTTQHPAKPTAQKSVQQSNKKVTTNKATATKTTTQPARQTADNKLTFSRAFANARKAGQKTFNYNGKSYTTQLAGEKKNNTNEKTYNTTKLANNRLMDVTETTKLPINTKTNTIPSSSSVIPKSNTLNIADNNGYYDRINMMKCGGKRKMKCGGKCKKK